MHYIKYMYQFCLAIHKTPNSDVSETYIVPISAVGQVRIEDESTPQNDPLGVNEESDGCLLNCLFGYRAAEFHDLPSQRLGHRKLAEFGVAGERDWLAVREALEDATGQRRQRVQAQRNRRLVNCPLE
jgi:hypothetical protein